MVILIGLLKYELEKKLPVLFICENNLYSVYSPLDVRQPKDRIIHKMVKGLGINTLSGNGNNVRFVERALGSSATVA